MSNIFRDAERSASAGMARAQNLAQLPEIVLRDISLMSSLGNRNGHASHVNRELTDVCVEISQRMGTIEPHRYPLKSRYSTEFENGRTLMVYTDTYVQDGRNPANCSIVVFDRDHNVIAERLPGYGFGEEVNPVLALSYLLRLVENQDAIKPLREHVAKLLRKDEESLQKAIEKLTAQKETVRAEADRLQGS